MKWNTPPAVPSPKARSLPQAEKNKWEDSLAEPFLNLMTKEGHSEIHLPLGHTTLQGTQCCSITGKSGKGWRSEKTAPAQENDTLPVRYAKSTMMRSDLNTHSTLPEHRTQPSTP